MEKRFVNLYSKSKRIQWEQDIITFPIDSCPSYQLRWNNFIYSKTTNRIHNVRFINKNIKEDLFYINKYKLISSEIIDFLPFDTFNFITQEIPSFSVYATKRNNRRFIYTRHTERNNKLEQLLRSDITLRHLIDRFAKQHIIEFKLYMDSIYIVNIFNENEILDIEKIKTIAERFDLKCPRKINKNVFIKGKQVLDRCYNDFYLNDNNMTPNLNYFLTFVFNNNKYLLYKI